MYVLDEQRPSFQTKLERRKNSLKVVQHRFQSVNSITSFGSI